MPIIMSILGVGVLVAVDQIIKIWAVSSLASIGSIPIIPNVFQLTYVENRGAAFSLLENQQWLFVIFAGLIVAAIIYALSKNMVQTNLGKIALLLICAGAIGNVIDRVARHFVVDMLYFSLIDFPVFNIADIYVCVGVAVFFFYTVFQHKDEEPKQNNEETEK